MENAATLGPPPWGIAALPQDVPGLSGLRSNHHSETIADLQSRMDGGRELCKTSMQGEKYAPIRERDLVHPLVDKTGSLMHHKLQDNRRFEVWQRGLAGQIPFE